MVSMGSNLWRTAYGTAAGTRLVRDVTPGLWEESLLTTTGNGVFISLAPPYGPRWHSQEGTHLAQQGPVQRYFVDFCIPGAANQQYFITVSRQCCAQITFFFGKAMALKKVQSSFERSRVLSERSLSARTPARQSWGNTLFFSSSGAALGKT